MRGRGKFEESAWGCGCGKFAENSRVRVVLKVFGKFEGMRARKVCGKFEGKGLGMRAWKVRGGVGVESS